MSSERRAIITISERINLYKSISIKLSKEDWSIIDITLHSYKFPTEEYFQGDSYYYILEMIKGEDDHKLLQLAEHLNILTNNQSSELKTNFWINGFFKLFISHKAENKDLATEIKAKLESYSVSSFVAHEDIEPTKEWQNEIELGLKTCDALLAIMTKGFHESNWTDQEIGYVIGREKLIIPIKMGEDLYGFIGKYQAIQFNDDTDKFCNELFEILLKNKKSNKMMANSIVHKFENSDSYARAKSNIELLERINYWDQNIKNRLLNSIENNSQIKDSYGVTPRVKKLIKNFENIK